MSVSTAHSELPARMLTGQALPVKGFCPEGLLETPCLMKKKHAADHQMKKTRAAGLCQAAVLKLHDTATAAVQSVCVAACHLLPAAMSQVLLHEEVTEPPIQMSHAQHVQNLFCYD